MRYLANKRELQQQLHPGLADLEFDGFYPINKNEAATAGTATASEIPTKENLTMTIVVDHEPRVSVRTAESTEPSAEDRSWAEENLASLPVKIGFSEKPIEHWTNTEGRWVRNCGHIDLIVGTAFIIWIRRGATSWDLSGLEREVDRAKAGEFIARAWDIHDDLPWRWELSFAIDGPHGWDRGSGSEYADMLRDQVILECTDPVCDQPFHKRFIDIEPEDEFVPHHSAKCATREGAQWSFSIERPDDGEWGVVLSVEDVRVDMIAALVSDLQDLETHVTNLNEWLRERGAR